MITIVMLTDKIISSLKPRFNKKTGKNEPYRKSDIKVENLKVQISQSDKSGKTYKTFQLAYKTLKDGGGEMSRFHKIGRYSRDFMLKDARIAATDLITKYISQGLDPKEEIKKQQLEDAKERRRQKSIGSITQLLAAYVLNLKNQNKKSCTDVQRAFDVDVIHGLPKDIKAQDIEPFEISSIIRKIVKRGSPRYADQVRGYLHAAFQYGMSLDYDPQNLSAIRYGIKYNPVSPIPKVQKNRPVGQRNLNKKEIRRVWQVLTRSGIHPYTAIVVKILITTGQRVQEVTAARWSELDLENGIWEIPDVRTKNNVTHCLPLNNIAVSLFNKARLFRNESDLVFPSSKDKNNPITWKAINRAVTRLCKDKKIKHFTPRDLRRTWKTLAGEAGLTKEIRDRLQNHNIQGVSAKHYDRYSYLKEKKVAISKWEVYLWNALTNKQKKENKVRYLHG